MRIAYLDCYSGISGDMFVGAAVDAGVPLALLAESVAALGLDVQLRARAVLRGGIRATKIDVLIDGHPDEPSDLEQAHEAHHAHEHEASAIALSDHGSAHSHHHSHAAEHEHPHVHRGLPEIRAILSAAPLSQRARDFALKAFALLAEAEAHVHQASPETIHFHEVGSEDAIADIVSAAVAIEHLDVARWYASPLNVGSGTVQCAHGVLPVPAPATAELLRGCPIFSAGPAKELLTPTGATILRALEVSFAPLPAIVPTATGHGAGAREFAGQANFVRLTLGDTVAACQLPHGASEAAISNENAAARETVTVLECNLDDMNPQLVPYVIDQLLAAGALDAFTTAVVMKKGRPGFMLSVLSPTALEEPLTRLLLTETTTLGVRMRREQRRILAREHVSVTTPWGAVRVKLGRLDGQLVNATPEFEDCRAVAVSSSTPLKLVLQAAQQSFGNLHPDFFEIGHAAHPTSHGPAGNSRTTDSAS